MGQAPHAADPTGRTALESAFLFGAICPARGVGAGVALPFADTEARQLHLEGTSLNVGGGAQAVLLLERVGWHTTGSLRQPQDHEPDPAAVALAGTQPVEQVWQSLRVKYLSTRLFATCNDIIGAACDAWRNLTAQSQTIALIRRREWALSATFEGRGNRPP